MYIFSNLIFLYFKILIMMKIYVFKCQKFHFFFLKKYKNKMLR